MVESSKPVPTEKEQLGDLREKIYLPEEFDEKIALGEVPLGLVKACTTMTLSRFMKDVQGLSMNQEQWIQTFRKKRTVEKKKWGPFRRTTLHEHDDPLPILHQNRDYMGWQIGMKDVLNSQYPEAAAIIFRKGNYAPILYLAREYTKRPILESVSDLHFLIKAANTYNDYSPSDPFIQDVARSLLLEPFGSFEAASNLIREASLRQGVQVAYGSSGYESYKSQMERVWKGSAFSSAECHEERLPVRFISGILPLGKYEQDILLSE